MPAVTDKHEPLAPATFDANGKAQIAYQSNSLIVVHQLMINTTCTRQTFCQITKGGSVARNNDIPIGSTGICSTRSGNLATASGSPSILLRPSELLTFTWNGGDEDAIANAAIHYQILEG